MYSTETKISLNNIYLFLCNGHTSFGQATYKGKVPKHFSNVTILHAYNCTYTVFDVSAFYSQKGF